MTRPETTQPGRRTGVFGLLLAAWLGLGIQPCAVAAGQDHDCPHCPPADTRESHAHHARAMTGADAHAGHGEQSGPPCGAMQADCCETGSATIDSRSGESRPHGDSPVALAVVPWWRDPAAVYSPEDDRFADPPQSPPVSITLHKLHCVYLD